MRHGESPPDQTGNERLRRKARGLQQTGGIVREGGKTVKTSWTRGQGGFLLVSPS